VSTATISNLTPIRGVTDGKRSADPAVRQAWLDQRAGGITATQIRDWGNASKRREIITEKVTGVNNDQSSLPVRGREHTLGVYAEHGNRRETVIAEWVKARYGLEPCEDVYTHPENLRHLASPDGVSRDPFTGELIVGTEDARLAEIKTGVKDLAPGKTLDGILVEVDQTSEFAKKNYYTQIQWQLYVMNATACLFVWEQHNDKIDPETGTFSPLGPPQAVWVMRDQPLIDVLVNEVAPKALAEIDAARAAYMADGLPAVGDLPGEHMILIADYRRALDAEAVAAAAKKKAWDALKAAYLGDDKPDIDKADAGEAWLTVTTNTTIKQVFDEDAARKKAPALMEKYEALVARYTKPVPVTTQKLTISAKRGEK